MFDREGAFVTGLSLPRMRMLDIGSHEIVAAYRDELDVQYLGVFEIRKETE